MAWPDERNLSVVVRDAALQRTLTRHAHGMMVTMTYEPASPTTPALPVPGNGATLPAK